MPLRLRTSRCTGHWRGAVTNAEDASAEDRAGRSPGFPRDCQGRRHAAEVPSKLEGSATSFFEAETAEAGNLKIAAHRAETSQTCAIPKPNLRHLCLHLIQLPTGQPLQPQEVARATWVMNP